MGDYRLVRKENRLVRYEYRLDRKNNKVRKEYRFVLNDFFSSFFVLIHN